MAQLLIRQLDEEVKERLRRRAKSHGVSMETEARSILGLELLNDEESRFGLGTQIATIARNIANNGKPFERVLSQPPRAAKFDE